MLYTIMLYIYGLGLIIADTPASDACATRDAKLFCVCWLLCLLHINLDPLILSVVLCILVCCGLDADHVRALPQFYIQ